MATRRQVHLGAVYEATTLRGHLGLPVPANRHTAAREGADVTV